MKPEQGIESGDATGAFQSTEVKTRNRRQTTNITAATSLLGFAIKRATLISMPATHNISTQREAFERAQRPIGAPRKVYPALKEGQMILGMTDVEFEELYVEAQNQIHIFYRRNPIRATTRKTAYGQRVENHESVVPNLEEQYQVLKLCSENWGAKWILKKAKQAVGVKTYKRKPITREDTVGQQIELTSPKAQEPKLHLEPDVTTPCHSWC